MPGEGETGPLAASAAVDWTGSGGMQVEIEAVPI